MKKSKRIIILAVAVVLILVTVGGYYFIKYQTFDCIENTRSYKNTSKDNANYKQWLNGVLRYSRDGISFLSETGEEIWNQPCQMNNPIVEISDNCVAIGDKGGTSILVFHKKGLKGEIHTTRPIDKLAVSSQGIVSAILKDEEMPLVMCYDAAGNVLVSNEVSLTTMGYPIDVAISKDGKTQIVSYLFTGGNEITTKIVYYYFGEFDAGKTGGPIYETEFSNAVIPVVSYLNESISILFADNALYFYKGTQEVEEIARVEIKKKIQSVAYGEDIIAVLVQNDKKANYKLQIYNLKGKLTAAVDVDKEYSKMQVSNGQIIMYDGQMCSIYNKEGICKYTGNVDENILEIFPVGGLNKYMMINASGFHEIHLVK